jgi:hypothetical protein
LTDTHPRRSAARPSLTSAGSSDEGPISILASLEHDQMPAAHRRPASRRWLGLGGIALVVAALVGYLFDRTASADGTDTVVARAELPVPAATVLPVTPAASAVSEMASPPQAAASAPQGARIETIDPAVATAARPAASGAPAGDDPFATLSREALRSGAAGGAPAALAASGVRSSPAAPSAPASAKVPVRKSSPGQTPKPRPAPRVAGQRRDPDVDLLAALMAHVAVPASSPQKPASHRTVRGGEAGGREHLSIAQLVQRCEAMQGSKAVECRRRLCEGYWGKAQACPAPRRAAKGEQGAR